MKKILSIAFLLLFALPFLAQPQIPVTYVWDPSTSPADPNNPVKYNLYVCTDASLSTCTKTDVGTPTTYSVNMSSGSYWVYIQAYRYAISADNPDGPFVGGPIEESPKSNVVATRVTVPPGNPSNARVRLQ